MIMHIDDWKFWLSFFLYGFGIAVLGILRDQDYAELRHLESRIRKIEEKENDDTTF